MTLRPADASAWVAVGAGSNGDNGGRSALWVRVARPSPAAYLRHLPGCQSDARTVPGSPVWRALTVVRLYSRTWYVLVQLHGCTTSTTSYLIDLLALSTHTQSTGTVVRYPS
eukprot:COSAG03_NODE_186_length_10940_cov_2.632967_10_plen_112_part_00